MKRKETGFPRMFENEIEVLLYAANCWEDVRKASCKHGEYISHNNSGFICKWCGVSLEETQKFNKKHYI